MGQLSITPSITVTIGRHTRMYYAFVTTAPADLDSPATITLHASTFADVVGFAADARPLPGEFHRVDEDESRRRSAETFVVRDGVGREPGDVGPRRRMQRQRGRRVEIGRRGGDEGDIQSRMAADRHRDAGCDRQLTHRGTPFLNGVQRVPTIT